MWEYWDFGDSGHVAYFQISNLDFSKANSFLAKSLHYFFNHTCINNIQSTEHGFVGRGVSILANGTAWISFPTDSRSSGGCDHQAQGRGLNIVKADPDLARRQSRLTRSGSAISLNWGLLSRKRVSFVQDDSDVILNRLYLVLCSHLAMSAFWRVDHAREHSIDSQHTENAYWNVRILRFRWFWTCRVFPNFKLRFLEGK